jgi:accessory gene regulator protein AgrB
MSGPVAELPFGPEDLRRRKRRAIAMALVLLGLVVLFFITTIVRMGGHSGAL